ncbi:hypothetical protein GGX14DRAFT_576386 [Mycena pura]|uniref:Uncharacterized protein n=1 Tax=Mycena pura TaxID=153505 RepID=A0AAD6UTY0_9AGAR|nr:hypothetical protein GGX14DRAFT_576386 [Mycena pura]
MGTRARSRLSLYSRQGFSRRWHDPRPLAPRVPPPGPHSPPVAAYRSPHASRPAVHRTTSATRRAAPSALPTAEVLGTQFWLRAPVLPAARCSPPFARRHCSPAPARCSSTQHSRRRCPPATHNAPLATLPPLYTTRTTARAVQLSPPVERPVHNSACRPLTLPAARRLHHARQRSPLAHTSRHSRCAARDTCAACRTLCRPFPSSCLLPAALCQFPASRRPPHLARVPATRHRVDPLPATCARVEQHPLLTPAIVARRRPHLHTSLRPLHAHRPLAHIASCSAHARHLRSPLAPATRTLNPPVARRPSPAAHNRRPSAAVHCTQPSRRLTSVARQLPAARPPATTPRCQPLAARPPVSVAGHSHLLAFRVHRQTPSAQRQDPPAAACARRTLHASRVRPRRSRPAARCPHPVSHCPCSLPIHGWVPHALDARRSQLGTRCQLMAARCAHPRPHPAIPAARRCIAPVAAHARHLPLVARWLPPLHISHRRLHAAYCSYPPPVARRSSLPAASSCRCSPPATRASYRRRLSASTSRNTRCPQTAKRDPAFCAQHPRLQTAGRHSAATRGSLGASRV